MIKLLKPKLIIGASILGFLFFCLCIFFDSTTYRNYLNQHDKFEIQSSLNSFEDQFVFIYNSFNENPKELSRANFTKLNKKSFSVFLFDGDEMKFWSSRNYVPENLILRIDDNTDWVYQNKNQSIYVQKRTLSDNKVLVFTLPLTDKNGRVCLLNSSLKDYNIIDENLNNQYLFPIGIGKENFMYLKEVDEFTKKTPAALVISWSLYTFFTLAFIILLFRNSVFQLPQITITTLFVFILFVFGYIIRSDLFGVQASFEIFQPTVYANKFIGNSLAELIIILTLGIVLLHYWYSKPILLSTYSGALSKKVQIGLCILGIAIVSFVFLFVLRSIIIDSSLEVYFFTSFDNKIILMIIAIILIGYLFFFYLLRIIRYLNLQLNTSTERYKFIFFLLIASLIILIFSFQLKLILVFLFFLLLLIIGLFYILRDNNQIKTISQVIFIISMLSLIVTYTFRVYNSEKDESRLKLIAQKISLEDDYLARYLLDEINLKMINDESLIDQLKFPAFTSDETIKSRISQLYLDKDLADYESSIFIDRNIKDLDKSELSVPKVELIQGDYEIIQFQNTIPFFIDDKLNTLIRIVLKRPKLINSVELNLNNFSEKINSKTAELSQNQRLSYTVIKDNEIVFLKGNIINSSLVDFNKLKLGGFKKIKAQNNDNYVYRFSDDSYLLLSVVFSDIANRAVITLSYVFTVIIFSYIFFVILLVGYKLSKLKFFSTSISNRLQFLVISIIYIAATVIGIISLNSMGKEINQLQSNGQSENLELIYSNFKDQYPQNIPTVQSLNFEEYLENNFNNTKYDYHLFNSSGSLIYSKNEKLFSDKIWLEKINPIALEQFEENPKTVLDLEETIFSQNYRGFYLGLRDSNFKLNSILYLPAFNFYNDTSREQNLFKNTLFSTFAIVLFVTTFFTLIFIQSFTKILENIRSRLSKVDLGLENKELEWKNEDEIGLLIQEYNNMVRKLDDNAVLLARSERESAWREVAKQIAHEIKNPLTPMKLSIQHLKRQLTHKNEDPDSPTFKTLDTLVTQIQHLSRIADDFSSVARMNLPEYKKINLRDSLNQAVHIFQHNDDYEFKVVNLVENKETFIYADITMLNRVFTNLIKNSVQALEPWRNGVIELRLEEDFTSFYVSVIDNGKGIPTENRAKIFTPNFTTKNSGTGIGLMMSKKIIDFHDGEIYFESKKDVGTTFTVKLPKYRKYRNEQLKDN